MSKISRRLKELQLLEKKLLPINNSLEVVNDSEALDDHDKSKKLKEKKFPYSCTNEEGLLLYKAVRLFNLKSGFEIATAFGYSSLFLGLAFKKNNGSLVSLDCYIEEWKESYNYDEQELAETTEKIKYQINQGELPIGLEYAKSHSNKLNLSKVVDYKVGISPTDLNNILVGKTIDMAFIDGGHFGEQPTKDFLGLYPYLNNKCIVFFHDNNQNPYVERAIAVVENKFNSQAINLNTRYSLTVIGRNINQQHLRKLLDLSIRNIINEVEDEKSWVQKIF